jgi:hypothetical protein
LDKLEFRTVASQSKFKMDNSCILYFFHDKSSRRRVLPTVLSFGVIKQMFYHKLWPGSEAKVVLDVDWYERIGDSPRNGLPQIKRNLNWDEQRVAFLEDCKPLNCCFWPSEPWNPPKDDADTLYDVVLHHDLLPPNT